MKKLLILLLAAGASSLSITTKTLKEYELKHARVAMLALPTLEALSSAGVSEPVKWLSSQPLETQLITFSVGGMLEAGATLPRFTGLLDLKDDVEPGRFEPLGPSTHKADQTELWIGRTAMLSTFAWMVNAVLLS